MDCLNGSLFVRVLRVCVADGLHLVGANRATEMTFGFVDPFAGRSESELAIQANALDEA